MYREASSEKEEDFYFFSVLFADFIFGWSNASMQDNYTHRELYDLGGIKTAVDAIKLEKQPSGHSI